MGFWLLLEPRLGRRLPRGPYLACLVTALLGYVLLSVPYEEMKISELSKQWPLLQSSRVFGLALTVGAFLATAAQYSDYVSPNTDYAARRVED